MSAPARRRSLPDRALRARLVHALVRALVRTLVHALLRSRALAFGALLAALATAAQAAPSATPGPLTLVQAERQIGAGPWQAVALPDWPLDPPTAPEPPVVRYRIEVPHPPPAPAGLLVEGLLANGSIVFNGQRLRDSVDPLGRTLPRGLDRMTVLALPAALWKPTGNVIEIEALAQPRMSVSRLQVGELAQLTERHRGLVMTRYVSPLLAGAVVGTLGLAMLALWFRLRDASSLLFAVGALAWWLVNWMPLFAWPRIGGVGYAIAWTSLYGVVVAAFAAFCLRLSQWRLPRLEKALAALGAAGAPLLAGAYAIDQMDIASSAWRLLLIAGVAVALAAVVRAWWLTRTATSLAMLGCGVVALVLGAIDWHADLDPTTNYPLSVSTYAGLAFAAVASALLVERYVEASRTSEALRSGLEERVHEQGAQLRTALGEMEAARDAARAADQAKSAFLAVASHDLRQPAHAIGLYLEAMPTEGLQPEQAEVLERLRRSHSALERMFDALLDMSQIDAGTLVPQRRTVRPWALMQRLADEAAPAAEAKGLRLALRAGGEAAAVRVHTDPVLLERMLRNLIGNAVKYTRDGGVLLACRMRGEGARRRLCLEVWDTGPGIDDAHRERIFDEFFRIGPGRSSVDGLGLGLPIVRRLARMLEVEVGVASRPGHGSCFRLSLAMVPGEAPQPAALPVAADPSLHDLGVGVLEDDPAVRDAMVRTLRRWGCRVLAAGSAAELLQAAAGEGLAGDRPIDLLIVDYGLGGGATGPAEALAFAAASAPQARVLVVTGEQTPERLQELAAMQLPWLPKPIPASTLKRTIATLMASVRPTPTG